MKVKAVSLIFLTWPLLFGPLAGAHSAPRFTTGADGLQYFSYGVEEDALSGPPDASHLNHTLDAADRIAVRGPHFFRVGPDQKPGTADDQRVRFFGANLSFAANFPAETDATALARRLRKLGFNAVRLHHIDTHLTDDTEQPNGILGTGPYPTFNDEAVKRLKTLVAALAEEGLYINLNLRVGYRFRPAIDGLPPLDDGQDTPPSVETPIHVYYPDLIERQKTYARDLILRLGLTRHPALAMVEINNESSLLHAWQGREWHNAIPSAYAPVLSQAWGQWLIEKYGNLDAACAAWSSCGDAAADALPAQGLFHQGGRVTYPRQMQDRLRKLLSPSRNNTAYNRDFLAFLTEMDRRYVDGMKAVVRDAVGWDVPVTGTQIGYGGVLNFDSQAQMDYVDDHIYVGHPMHNGPSWRSEDWYIPEIAISDTGIETLLARSLRRDANKPFVVSEFNQPFPARTGSEILPLIAAVAALQDWDGLFFYGYSSESSPFPAPERFSLSGDWSKYALSGQSARLFRHELIATLPKRVLLPFPPKARMETALEGDIYDGTLEARLRKIFKLNPTAAWVAQLAQDLSAADESFPGLDTAEHSRAGSGIIHQKARRRILMDAPRIAGIFGLLDREAVALGQFRVAGLRDTPEPVSLLMTPLDDEDLVRSNHMLVTLAGFTTGSQAGSIPKRPKVAISYLANNSGKRTLEPEPGSSGKPSGLLHGQAPTWVERTPVRFFLPYAPERVALYPLDGAGRRGQPLPIGPDLASADASVADLQQTPDDASLWYELLVTPAGAGAP